MEFLNAIGGYAIGLLGAGLAAFLACIGSAKSRPACDTERFTADSARTAKQSGSFPHRSL